MMGPNVPIYDSLIRHTTDTLCYIEYVYVIYVRNIGTKWHQPMLFGLVRLTPNRSG
jgi:hypothetical protein